MLLVSSSSSCVLASRKERNRKHAREHRSRRRALVNYLKNLITDLDFEKAFIKALPARHGLGDCFSDISEDAEDGDGLSSDSEQRGNNSVSLRSVYELVMDEEATYAQQTSDFLQQLKITTDLAAAYAPPQPSKQAAPPPPLPPAAGPSVAPISDPRLEFFPERSKPSPPPRQLPESLQRLRGGDPQHRQGLLYDLGSSVRRAQLAGVRADDILAFVANVLDNYPGRSLAQEPAPLSYSPPHPTPYSWPHPVESGSPQLPPSISPDFWGPGPSAFYPPQSQHRRRELPVAADLSPRKRQRIGGPHG